MGRDARQRPVGTLGRREISPLTQDGLSEYPAFSTATPSQSDSTHRNGIELPADKPTLKTPAISRSHLPRPALDGMLAPPDHLRV